MPAIVATDTIKSPFPVRPRPTRRIGPNTVADWVAFERTTQKKHELHNGEYVEMSGGTFEHSVIAMEMARLIGNLLAEANSECRVAGSDLKVYIAPRKGYYPDITIVCGDPQIDFEEVLRNPFVIVEVLSESTAGFDRGEKFQDYRTIDSLCHFIMVEQNRPCVEHYERTDSGSWTLRSNTSLVESLSLTLTDTAIAVPLDRIYRGITFPTPADDAPAESTD